MLDQSCFWEYEDTFIWEGVGCTFSAVIKERKITSFFLPTRKITKIEKRQDFIHMHIHCVYLLFSCYCIFLGPVIPLYYLMSMFSLIDDPHGTFSM